MCAIRIIWGGRRAPCSQSLLNSGRELYDHRPSLPISTNPCLSKFLSESARTHLIPWSSPVGRCCSSLHLSASPATSPAALPPSSALCSLRPVARSTLRVPQQQRTRGGRAKEEEVSHVRSLGGRLKDRVVLGIEHNTVMSVTSNECQLQVETRACLFRQVVHSDKGREP